jgi:ribose 5-phosphate isomerase B
MSTEPDDIAAIVREVVTRTLGAGGQRVVVGEEAVRQMPHGSRQQIPADALITPLAHQIAVEQNIRLVRETSATMVHESAPHATKSDSPNVSASDESRLVAVGADHGGFDMKERIKDILKETGYGIIDCGTNSSDSVDYPDFAFAVARQVADGRAWRGIIVDGAGIGSCMAANKVPGIRAAMCYDQATAVNSREHNNANVLTLGAGLIGPNLARQIVTTWLDTGFGGGRHGRRVDKIDAIDRRFAK